MTLSVGPQRISIVKYDVCRTHKNDVPEPTGGKEEVDPRFDLGHLDVETRRDDACLVESAIQLNDNLSGTVVIDDLKFTNVPCKATVIVVQSEQGARLVGPLTMTLYDAQKFNDNFGGRSDENLAFSAALCVDDVVLQDRLKCIQQSRVSTDSRGSRSKWCVGGSSWDMERASAHQDGNADHFD